MALTHSMAARNAAADAVVDLIDAGGGASYGLLRILTSGDVLLSSHTMSNPAFGAASGGVATASAIADAVAGATGTAAKFEVVDLGAATVVSGTVTATGGGGDITLDNVSVASGQTVSITSLTYQGESQ